LTHRRRAEANDAASAATTSAMVQPRQWLVAHHAGMKVSENGWHGDRSTAYAGFINLPEE